ncbi:MAG: glycosyltransferase, partial [Candidatus Lokiarchaeota archaeon]
LNLENILSDDDKIISYIGYTIFHQKVEGMIDFLKGFSEFLRSIESITLRKKFKLLYIGDGKFSARLVKAIKKSNLEGNVFFLGERNDIKHILAISDLLALTSYTEGFSMALLEAMASNVPVIASNVGESKYIVNNTGFLVTPGNYLQIAEKLSNYFDLPDSKIRYYQIKAQERIKNNFDIKIIVKKLLNQIYSS